MRRRVRSAIDSSENGGSVACVIVIFKLLTAESCVEKARGENRHSLTKTADNIYNFSRTGLEAVSRILYSVGQAK